jgi:hypothetical protein
MSAVSGLRWPAIPVAEWCDTRDTLHLYTQVVGKIRLANEPMTNRSRRTRTRWAAAGGGPEDRDRRGASTPTRIPNRPAFVIGPSYQPLGAGTIN